MENKEFESGQEALLILREIAEKIGYSPDQEKLNLGEDEDERRRGPRVDRKKS